MATRQARVATEHASRYLQQLCKHWSHKFEVAFDPTSGTVALPNARLALAADPEALRLSLDGDEADLDRLAEVVAQHIRRFAFREELAFDWRRDA